MKKFLASFPKKFTLSRIVEEERREKTGDRRGAIHRAHPLRVWFDRALKKIIIRCPRCALNIKIDEKEIPSVK